MALGLIRILWFSRALLCFYVYTLDIRMYCLREQLNVCFGYNYCCTQDDVYSSCMHICVRKLVTDSLDATKLVTDGPGVSDDMLTKILASPKFRKIEGVVMW